jgi:toxin HigB-1
MGKRGASGIEEVAAAPPGRTLNDLRAPPNNRLEKLRGDRAGQYSIRVNDQYRICFRWEGSDAFDVEMTDYH